MSAEVEPAGSPSPAAPRTVALWGIFVLLLLFALYFSRAIVLPVVFAALANVVLSPLIRALRRRGVPAPLAAGALLLLLVGATGFGIAALSAPAAEWLKRAPDGVQEIQRKLRFLRDPVARVSRATEQVEKAARLPGSEPEQTVVVKPHRLGDVLFAQTQGFLSGLLVAAVLLFFLLSSPDGFLEKAIELAPRLEDKKRIVAAVREIESEVSKFLLTVSTINAVFGTAVGVGMALVGVPNAALWGVVAGVTNFVPYIGALTMVIVLSAVGVLSFDDPARMFLPAGVFVMLNAIEANLATPYIMSRRLTLSPVAVLVWVVLWSWIWGVPGGLIAVPCLAALKIAFQHVPSLAPIARLID